MNETLPLEDGVGGALDDAEVGVMGAHGGDIDVESFEVPDERDAAFALTWTQWDVAYQVLNSAPFLRNCEECSIVPLRFMLNLTRHTPQPPAIQSRASGHPPHTFDLPKTIKNDCTHELTQCSGKADGEVIRHKFKILGCFGKFLSVLKSIFLKKLETRLHYKIQF